MKIMTWNTALTEGSDATAVINYVKEFLDKEDDTMYYMSYKKSTNESYISKR